HLPDETWIEICVSQRVIKIEPVNAKISRILGTEAARIGRGIKSDALEAIPGAERIGCRGNRVFLGALRDRRGPTLDTKQGYEQPDHRERTDGRDSSARGIFARCRPASAGISLHAVSPFHDARPARVSLRAIKHRINLIQFEGNYKYSPERAFNLLIPLFKCSIPAALGRARRASLGA
ncbi:MAG TPA: hypothetical protein VKG05_06545, partial [Steroidobacteraceae bacterium]|nr:hypothetical protein [Steroidobacteraceae bacterium]